MLHSKKCLPVKKRMVLEEGLEPPRSCGPREFESFTRIRNMLRYKDLYFIYAKVCK
jgi:hypothetical protein